MNLPVLRGEVEGSRPVFVRIESYDALDLVVVCFQCERTGDVENAANTAVAGGDVERAEAGKVDGNWAVWWFDGALMSDEVLSGACGQALKWKRRDYRDSLLQWCRRWYPLSRCRQRSRTFRLYGRPEWSWASPSQSSWYAKCRHQRKILEAWLWRRTASCDDEGIELR